MAETGNTNNEFPTILGPDASFKGELNFEKGMRLMGKFEGKMSTPGRVHITKEAKMAADVESGSIVVEGDVHGNLSASERVELKNTARYEGDLKASKLVVEDGAIFSGHVQVGPEAVKTGPRPGAGGNSQHQNRFADAKPGDGKAGDGKNPDFKNADGKAPQPQGQK